MQCAREASLSVNALVSGVLLTGLRSLLRTQEDGLARLLCTTAVDMRRRLTPVLPAEVLQSAATTTSIGLEVSKEACPAAVGQDLAALLRADLDSGAAAMELAAFPTCSTSTRPASSSPTWAPSPNPSCPRGCGSVTSAWLRSAMYR
ncbi:hypothetical protein NKH18_02620 [Streptomyces sp. M10(2022)]